MPTTVSDGASATAPLSRRVSQFRQPPTNMNAWCKQQVGSICHSGQDCRWTRQPIHCRVEWCRSHTTKSQLVFSQTKSTHQACGMFFSAQQALNKCQCSFTYEMVTMSELRPTWKRTECGTSPACAKVSRLDGPKGNWNGREKRRVVRMGVWGRM